MASSAVARIRSAALEHNLHRVRSAAPAAPVLAVIKADGYGHGLERVAAVLSSADGFGVARLSEALRLRRAGVDKPVLVMSERFETDDLTAAREHDLWLVVHSESQVALLAGLPEGPALSVWLKIDSGMGRLGVAPGRARHMLERLQACAAVAPGIVLMTHLASADERGDPTTPEQLLCFGEAIGDWPGDVSIANSAGILGWPDALRPGPGLRYAGRNWVRPGLMLYGVSPFAGQGPADAGLEPAMTLEARLISVRDLPAGSRVGYGGEWQAARDSRIGVVEVGYADGYPWRIPGGTPVRIGGAEAPVVGRISMDMISVDLTDAPGARSGDAVTLWGPRPHIADLAARAGTSPYELLTGVGNRVERVLDES